MILNEATLNYIFIFILLEIYEISWQKAPSIMGMLIRMHKHYSKSILLFLFMQPTFIFAIGIAILSDYNMYALIFMFIKTVDIATKIILIEQVFIKRKLSHELSLILLAPINSFLPYMGLFVYPPLILLSV